MIAMKPLASANNRGKLFVFEGPDDVGKTTLADMLSDYLSDKGLVDDLEAMDSKGIEKLVLKDHKHKK